MKLARIRKTVAQRLTESVAPLLARMAITPTALTCFGFLLALAAAALIIWEHFFVAGLVVLIAGFFDLLDGAVARYANRTTHFGAVLDSTLDRLSEAVVLLAILWLFASEQLIGQTLLVAVTLVGALLVSYIRARAEALDIKCEAGLFTRAERVIVLALGLLLYHIPYALVIALAVVAIFSFITVAQRLLYVWQQTKIE